MTIWPPAAYYLLAVLLVLQPWGLLAQKKTPIVFDGQLSAFGQYAPRQDMPLRLGTRYLPELSYQLPLDSTRKFDVLMSANVYGQVAIEPFDRGQTSGSIDPYRMWARYSTQQWEVRLGLQKIDFGHARLLRPLQWFNQVDPRDPLGITNGVYGALGRYYFLSNTNIWGWVLYGNNERKGFELMATQRNTVEMGGRAQFPVPRGEVAFTYHHRKARFNPFPLPAINDISENRYAFDAKWDITIGLWVEGSLIHKSKNIGPLTSQKLLNIGADYTFLTGNGLNIAVEHLLWSTSEKPLAAGSASHFSALLLSYPIDHANTIDAATSFQWDTAEASLFINYAHTFRIFTGYVILYYNPDTRGTLINNDAGYSLSGPGLQLMLVYHH